MTKRLLMVWGLCFMLPVLLVYSVWRVWDYYVTPDISLLMERARQDDVDALMTLAWCYKLGVGTRPSEQECDKCGKRLAQVYERMARGGCPDAQARYASLDYTGEGLQKDAAEDHEWRRRAAAQGCAEAMVGLVVDYQDGDGCAVNPEEQHKWLQRLRALAESGHADAQYHLAMYMGSRQGADSEEYEPWFRAAAERGHIKAILTMRMISGMNELPPHQDEWGKKLNEVCERKAAQGDKAALGYLYAYKIEVCMKESDSLLAYVHHLRMLRHGIESGSSLCVYEWHRLRRW